MPDGTRMVIGCDSAVSGQRRGHYSADQPLFEEAMDYRSEVVHFAVLLRVNCIRYRSQHESVAAPLSLVRGTLAMA